MPKKALCLTKSPETCNEVDAEIKIEILAKWQAMWNSPERNSALFHISHPLRKKKEIQNNERGTERLYFVNGGGYNDVYEIMHG